MNTIFLVVLSAYLSCADTTNVNTQLDTQTEKSHLIKGGAGNDTIHGSPAAERLFGGKGADTFVVDLNDQSVDTIMDFNPREGDTVLLMLNGKKNDNERKRLKLPKKLDFGNFQIDYKGNVNILINNNTWIPFLNMSRTDLYMRVEDKTDKVRLIFEKKF